MVRSLYSGAAGMIAQQTSVDVIANNLANVNTVGYKSESTEFKSLLYQELQAKTTTANMEQKPVSAQVGLGARVASITSHFTQGSAQSTDSNSDFMIVGNGFFGVQDLNGDMLYTRNGNFYFAVATEGSMLCTSDGYPVMNTEGSPIVLPSDFLASSVSVDNDGNLCYPDEDNNPQPIGIQIGLFQFANPSGLNKVGSNYLQESEASGMALNEAYDDVGKRSSMKQGYLEASNVNVATEMVNLITSQRAYELNSKVITTSDTMLEQANNLKR